MDYADTEVFNRVFCESDIVFLLSSPSVPRSIREPIGDEYMQNIAFFAPVIESLSKAKCKKVVFISSGGTVYGVSSCNPISEDHPTTPITLYGAIKLSIENLIRLTSISSDFDFISLRLSNPYGPSLGAQLRNGVISAFLKRIYSKNDIILYGDGSIVRDYLYIDDLVRAIVLAGVSPPGVRGIFNLGSGRGYSLLRILEKAGSIVGCDFSVTRLPPREFDVPFNIMNINKFSAQFRWTPHVGIDQGISLTAKSIRESLHLYRA